MQTHLPTAQQAAAQQDYLLGLLPVLLLGAGSLLTDLGNSLILLLSLRSLLTLEGLNLFLQQEKLAPSGLGSLLKSLPRAGDGLQMAEL